MATQRQNDRLLNAAQALREYEHPERFDMNFYLHGDRCDDSFKNEPTPAEWCGTPGCVLGTFASRPDLQQLLQVAVDTYNKDVRDEETLEWKTITIKYPTMKFRDSGVSAHYDNAQLCRYFGLTQEEADELFSTTGCNGAKTPIAAAKYIEKFVKNRQIG